MKKFTKYLAWYNAFLFPTFSENYGHVIAEALSVGTAVITDVNSMALDIKKQKQDGQFRWTIEKNS